MPSNIMLFLKVTPKVFKTEIITLDVLKIYRYAPLSRFAKKINRINNVIIIRWHLHKFQKIKHLKNTKIIITNFIVIFTNTPLCCLLFLSCTLIF